MTADRKKDRRGNCANPTARTLAELRKRGYLAGKVEQRLPKVNITRDLFGLIDVLSLAYGHGYVKDGVVGDGPDVLGVQATSGSNHAARVAKALAEPNLRTVLAAGVRFEVWSWTLAGPRGKPKRWTLRTQELTLEDLP